MLLAVYHEVSEVITGDLPSPIKYFDPQIKRAYAEIEDVARKRIWEMIPEELRDYYRSVIFVDEEDHENWQIVKAADKISAYAKCLEELKAGNQEFSQAKDATEQAIERFELPEVDYFMKTFVHSYSLELDDLN